MGEGKIWREERRLEHRERDYLGIVSFGILIVIIGSLLLYYPWIPSDIGDFFDTLSEGELVRPSTRLINALALFLALLGISNFTVAGVRSISRQPWRRPLSDMLSGVSFISSAYFIRLYAQEEIAWQMVVLLVLTIIGVCLIVYGVIGSLIES